MSPTTTHAELYDGARRRIVALVEDADTTLPVAACPGWSVKDLVAHLAGGLDDFVNRRFDGGEHANMGERNVHERRDRSLADCLAEWDANRAAADDALDSPMSGVLVAEIVSHEHDIRTALGRPGARDDDGVRVAVERPLQEIDKRLREAGEPAVRLVVDGAERVLGDGQATDTLRVTPFDLLRIVGGRRSERQIRALPWEGTPRPEVFTLFGGPRDDDLEE